MKAQHHRAKLPFEKVQQIRKMHATGTVGYVILARVFECSISTIRDIVTLRTRITR